MKPSNEENYVIEVTKEVMHEINQMYIHSDTEPVVELHYSPYWRKQEEQS